MIWIWRALLLTAGIVFALAGYLAPSDWYDALPRSADLPDPPVKGVTLLQISLYIQGLALILISLNRRSFIRLRPAERLMVMGAPADEAYDKRLSIYLLAAITALALALRLININSDLWLDEIATAQTYSQAPLLHIIAGYTSSNNQLLNTLLVKLAVTVAGNQEWAIRLPAALFGVATIPALYWVARMALSRRASLVAALLLAVSYHHIFFSQNARSYTAYLLFSLLSSRLLAQALQEDRARDWALYVLAMLLNFAALLNSGFVFAAHILVGLMALIIVKRRGSSPIPLFRRLSMVFGLLASLGFQLYALILPQAYVISRVVYTDRSIGFSPFSVEFLKELTRGLSAGVGARLGLGLSIGLILVALPFLAVVADGFLIVFRRQWALAAALVLPLVLTAVFLLVNRFIFFPRFFLLGLPLVILSLTQGLFSLADLVADRLRKGRKTFAPRLATALGMAVCVGFLAPLRHYYSVPKQSYRASIKYLEELRKPDGVVIAVYLSEAGYQYYGPRAGLEEGANCYFVRTLAALETTLAKNRGRRVFLVTTFPRQLRIAAPDLDARISQGWDIDRSFPATIGDGEIFIWRPRQPQ
jgi:mannosyltransferase